MTIKKLLVFEYITGGGLAAKDLPPSLAKEGRLMLSRLIDELDSISSIDLTILLDWRFKGQINGRFSAIDISARQSVFDLLPELIEQHDTIWLIAPESEQILQKLTVLVQAQNKQLLGSHFDAIRLCADKQATTLHLQDGGVNAVESLPLTSYEQLNDQIKIIKPNQAEGCYRQYRVESELEYQQTVQKIPDPSAFIIQPYIEGDALSLSCLFNKGQAWLLCCNRQHIYYSKTIRLTACEVNISSDKVADYQVLIHHIAQLIPDLWGYVGIDLIQPLDSEAVVLEINPRLTTSYSGIGQALGLNVAQIIIGMIDHPPVLNPTQNQTIWVKI